MALSLLAFYTKTKDYNIMKQPSKQAYDNFTEHTPRIKMSQAHLSDIHAPVANRL